MAIDSIVNYWVHQTHTDSGVWVHPEDEELLSTGDHSFNLDFPAGAFVGDILNAPVIILGANGGYNQNTTPREFEDEGSIDTYLARISSPSTADWNDVSPYYDEVNYSSLLFDGRAVLINACAYRSPRISGEPENKKIIERLRSVAFTRAWLIESVLPLAKSGERLIIAKRHGLWDLSEETKNAKNVVIDPAPVSKHITKKIIQIIQEFLA